MKILKNIEDKNEQQLEAIEDQLDKQLNAIKYVNVVSKSLKAINFFSRLSPDPKQLLNEIKKQ